LGAIYLLSFVTDALACDREDGRRRAYTLTTACGFLLPLLSAFFVLRSHSVSGLDATAAAELRGIDASIYESLESDIQKTLLILSAMLLVSVVISLLLRDVYFIDTAVAAIPMVYAIYLFFAERLPALSTTIVLLCVFYFVCRLMLMIGEPMKK